MIHSHIGYLVLKHCHFTTAEGKKVVTLISMLILQLKLYFYYPI